MDKLCTSEFSLQMGVRMSRIRTIKPEFWRDQDLSEISAEAALLAVGILNHSDDDGYFIANPKLVQADVFPLRELSCSTTVLLNELLSIGYIDLFIGTDGKQYGQVANFSKHQVINKRTDSKISMLRLLPSDYGSSEVVLRSGKERKGKEVEREMEREGECEGKKHASKFDALAMTIPECISSESWGSWIRYRRKRKLTTIQETMEGQISFLEDQFKLGSNPDMIILTSINNGWQGLFETKPPAKLKSVDNRAAADRAYEMLMARDNVIEGEVVNG